MERDNKQLHIWPDHETEIDLLGFSHLVDGVVDIVDSPHLLPATIGAFGDWGSGKSSLLTMVAQRLEEDDDTLVLWFNGWHFEGYDDAKAALMETIVEEVQAKIPLMASGKKLALNLLRRINWFRVAGGTLKYGAKYGTALATGGPILAGAAAASEAKAAMAKVGDSIENLDESALDGALQESHSASLRNIRGFREAFDDLLKETKLKRVVVMIDDLDRCLPDTVIETLEAIKLFLFSSKTAFIIGADERLVKYAVRSRFPELPGDRTEVGRDYLEKLIQFPIRVPQLSPSEMESYISLLFVEACTNQIDEARAWVEDASHALVGRSFDADAARQVLKDGDIPGPLEEGLTLSNRVGHLLARGLNGNPRQCKRFLNTLVSRLRMARARKQDLKVQVLAKLMLLEYFRPETFRRLAKLQAEQQGFPQELKLLELKATTSSEALEEDTQDDDSRSNGNDSGLRNPAAPLPASIRAWIEDSFTSEWLRLDPTIGREDLRPYFYFSRDNLNTTGAVVVRLTPAAQECIRKLLSESEAVRRSATSDAGQLSAADAAAVFEELAGRARRDEDSSVDNSPLNAMMRLAEARSDLVGQLVLVLEGLPEPMVPFPIVPLLRRLTLGGSSEGPAQELLMRWSKSDTNVELKTAAERALKPKTTT